MDTFVENFERLIGLHHLTARDASHLLGITESTLSKWSTGARRPSFESALKAGDFFKVDPGRLARASFDDLLAHELSDPKRYQAVEEGIRIKLSRIPDTMDIGEEIETIAIRPEPIPTEPAELPAERKAVVHMHERAGER